jgi:hypothetical protein
MHSFHNMEINSYFCSIISWTPKENFSVALRRMRWWAMNFEGRLSEWSWSIVKYSPVGTEKKYENLNQDISSQGREMKQILIPTRRLWCPAVSVNSTRRPRPLWGHSLRLGSTVSEVSQVFCFLFCIEGWNLKGSESLRRFGQRVECLYCGVKTWVHAPVHWPQVRDWDWFYWRALTITHTGSHKRLLCHIRPSYFPVAFISSQAECLFSNSRYDIDHHSKWI